MNRWQSVDATTVNGDASRQPVRGGTFRLWGVLRSRVQREAEQQKGGTRLRAPGDLHQDGFFWPAVPNATLLASRSHNS